MTNYTAALAAAQASYRLDTHNRPLRLVLERPGAQNECALLPQQVSGSESICGGFTFHILCISESATLPLKDCIGAPLELQVVTDSGNLRRWCGIVTAAASGQSDGGLAIYKLTDGLPFRSERLVQTGYYIPRYSDATAVFVLARRERVEPLRPYVWDDPENDYLQENLRFMYFGLEKTSPPPASMKEAYGDLKIRRQPTTAEWLSAAAAFAKHPVYEHKDGTVLDTFKRWINHPPKDWKPTPWFPLPWNRNQMEAFDRLPSLGFVHRPVFVKFEDEHGQPVKRRDARQKILEAGWQQALQTLPDAARTGGPARIIAAFDKNTEQLSALESLLHGYAAQGGPAIDSGKTAQFIGTERRMGNTGAATFFVQMAVGVMGSYIEGGPSAAINLRDPTGASIVFISPPAEENATSRV